MNDNSKVRRIATACYLIDALCLRVGDEKDPDEADTVGATTLRPEHIKIHDNGIVEFRFLGKDSVLWHKKIELPDHVRKNLLELSEHAKPSVSVRNNKKHPIYSKPQLFYDVSSRNVNAFLAEAMTGLSAKVFRTHHATHIVRESLAEANIKKEDPEYKKWETATKANTLAAILCNHTKQAPKNWSERKKRYRERELKGKERIKSIQVLLKELKQDVTFLKKERIIKKKNAKNNEQKRIISVRYEKRIKSKLARIESTVVREEKAQVALGKIKAQMAIAMENRSWNLGTSQKSYIDPRVFHNWGMRVDYDVLERYYSKMLTLKFQWVYSKEFNPEIKEPETNQ